MIPELKKETYDSTISKHLQDLKTNPAEVISRMKERILSLREKQPYLMEMFSEMSNYSILMDMATPGLGLMTMEGFFIQALSALYKQQEVNELEEMFNEPVSENSTETD